jgi:hypothetical protein
MDDGRSMAHHRQKTSPLPKNDGAATYGYDALGRMTIHDTTTYTYTGDGVLIDDGTTRYTQDLASPLSQVLQTTQMVYYRRTIVLRMIS